MSIFTIFAIFILQLDIVLTIKLYVYLLFCCIVVGIFFLQWKERILLYFNMGLIILQVN